MYQAAIRAYTTLEFYQQSLLTLTHSPSSGGDPNPSLCFARNQSVTLTLRGQALTVNGSLWVPRNPKFAVIAISPSYPLFSFPPCACFCISQLPSFKRCTKCQASAHTYQEVWSIKDSGSSICKPSRTTVAITANHPCFQCSQYK